MTDRLCAAVRSVQDRYLRDPAFAHTEAVDAHVRWLSEEQERVAGELWDEVSAERAGGLRGAEAVRVALEVYARAEDRVIEREIIGKLPPRLVHEMRSSWVYMEAEVTEPLDPARVDSGPLGTVHWYDRAGEAHVDAPERVGNPWYYRGADPIEDVALAPKVAWTDADKKAASERAIESCGLEPGQWIDMEWPPRASLWSEGNVYVTDFEQCPAHADEDNEQVTNDCPDCQASAREVVEDMAQWKWTTTLWIREIGFDRDGREYDTEVYIDQAFEVATTEQDPRDIRIGPPGRGERW